MDTGKARKRTCPQRYRSSKEKHIQESASIAAFAVLGSGLREKSPWTSIEDRVLSSFPADGGGTHGTMLGASELTETEVTLYGGSRNPVFRSSN